MLIQRSWYIENPLGMKVKGFLASEKNKNKKKIQATAKHSNLLMRFAVDLYYSGSIYFRSFKET